MIRNKLYKGFMYTLAFLMSFVISYVIGFAIVSVIGTVVSVISSLCYRPLIEYMSKNYAKIVLLSSLLPCFIVLKSVWKNTK